MRTVLMTLIVLALSAPPVLARTWRVYEDGSGHAPTVQAAIDSAGDGDVVLVGPGTYYENINLRGRAIELRSTNGPESTVLDGSKGDNSVITCDSGESGSTLITGFTITGGHGFPRTPYSRVGGGIRCSDSCPRIEHNVITENTALGDQDSNSRGGGISFGGPNACQVRIEDNLIQNNLARANGGGINIEGPCVIEGNALCNNETQLGDGGGVYKLSSHDARIVSNLFLGNKAADHGGAIYVARSSGSPDQVLIFKNVIIGNLAEGIGGNSDCSGGGIFMAIAGALVKQNTIAFNNAHATAMDGGGGICLYDTSPDVLVERNILFRNYEGAIRTFTRFAPSAGTIRWNIMFDNGHGDIKLTDPSVVTLEGNLFTDPLFCVLSRFDSRGELSTHSPALHSPYGVIGAVASGSCGPEICCVKVAHITWGRLKARYR